MSSGWVVNDAAAWRARVLGCVLAGAVGDALGAPVEFLSIEQIRAHFGPDGLTGYALARSGVAEITDDTQMTLFTLEGLIQANIRQRTRGVVGVADVLQQSYLRWLHTQLPREDGEPDRGESLTGWLVSVPGLFAQRAPGNTCVRALRALRDGATPGTPERPINDSKGCGGVMRAAPAALWSQGEPSEVFRVGVEAAALTHGHPSGYLSAGMLAAIVQQLLCGADLAAAIAVARAELLRWPGHGEQLAALDAAVALARQGRPTPEQIAARLGGGWVGEEALAIAVCAALAARDLADGLLLAVNHSGDSDSTGSIAGNILGALHGDGAIPSSWLDHLELRDVITTLALDAVAEFGAHQELEAINRYE